MFALLIWFLCVILHTMWLGKSLQLRCIFVCHQNDVCEDSIISVYVGGYRDLSESEPCVFGKLCPVDFLVVCECSSSFFVHVVC